jgi:hypothetical protein
MPSLFRTPYWLPLILASWQISAAVVPGHVEAWGDNSFGQATPPPGLNDVIAVAGGFGHSLALRSNGTVVAWGSNTHGESDVPQGLTNVVGIAARGHSVAVRADGTVVVWGGYNGEFLVTNVPPNLNDAIAVSAGGGGNGNVYTLALRRNGTVVAWGNNESDLQVPPGLSNVVQISAGYVHSLAVKSDGTFVGWGSDNFGVTTPPVGLSKVIAVAAGQSTSIAVKPEGTVVVWGGAFDSNDVPATVSGVIRVQAGNQHVLALRTNGTVLAWGAPYAGFVPEGINGVFAIAAGANHNLVVTARPLINSISPPVQAAVGAGVTLSVAATGQPLTYQWQHFGANLPAGTNSSFVITRAQPLHAGPYRVIVTNPHGTNTAATSISFPPPTITSQARDLTLYRGEEAAFSVTATGLTPFTYQWFKETNAIPGATNRILTMPTSDRSDSGSYHVVISDTAGGSVASDDVFLIVIDPRPHTLQLRPALDTSIHSSGGNPQGTATILAGTRRNLIVDRGLLQFDLTSIPTNFVVESAHLQLVLVRAPGSPAESVFSVHRVLTPWSAAANWTSASAGLPWSAPGGAPNDDYTVAGTPGESLFDSSVYTFGGVGTNQLVADVRAWIQNPATNHGWILISDGESVPETARHFGSSESASPPVLIVSYSIPAPAPTITAPAIQSTHFTFQINGSPGWFYNIQTRDEVDRGLWTAFTNAPAGNALSPILISIPLTNTHQFFRAFRY